MTDQPNPDNGDAGGAAAAGGTADEGRSFSVQKLYLKDVSYEAPSVPSVFAAGNQLDPKINMQLNTETKRLSETLHEVVLKITVTAADPEQDRTAFLVEIQQAGLFHVAGFDDDQLAHLIGSYCPGILFPFAREVVAGLVQKGGMPQLLLQPINFDVLYAQHAERYRQEQAGEQPEASAEPETGSRD